MDTTTTTEAPITEAEAATPQKPKRAIKAPGTKAPAKTAVKPKPTKAAAPAQEKAATINAHIAAGLDVNLYPGLSKFVNANRKVAVRTDVVATVDDMTDRMQKGLYALRKAYGGKSWSARGFDNGILAHLRAAGLIALDGGHTQTIDGHPKLTDGEKPVTGKLTAAGMKYGVA